MSQAEYDDTLARLVGEHAQEFQRFNERLERLSGLSGAYLETVDTRIKNLGLSALTFGVGGIVPLALGVSLGPVGAVAVAFALSGGLVGSVISGTELLLDKEHNPKLDVAISIGSDPLSLVG